MCFYVHLVVTFVTPEGKWTMDNGQDIHLIMTGGEPLLAWQRLYVELFEHPRMKDLKNVTFETNTTQHLHQDLFNYLTDNDRITVTWSCSPKLSVSGEPWDTAIKPDVAREYQLVDGSDIYLKFVVATQEDGDFPQDYTYHSSEMLGELDALHAIKQETNEQLEKAMKAPINEDRIRKAGW